MAGGLISPPPPIRTTLKEINMILMTSRVPIGILPFSVYTLLNPLNSCLRCGPTAKAPYLKVNTQPIKSSWTVAAVGGWGLGAGDGFLLCDT